MIRTICGSGILFMVLLAFSCQQAQEEQDHSTGRIYSYESILSQYVQPRNVDIWVPPGYDPGRVEGYPVLYMHDGQNLFDTTKAFGGMEWQVDETLSRLIREDKIEPVIVVGIWNTQWRMREYVPEAPFNAVPDSARPVFEEMVDGEPLSDEYLKFIVNELKPFVDEHFHTIRAARKTLIAGSSMGGLISLYALVQYPEVFGSAACLSTHWPLVFEKGNYAFTRAMVEYLDHHYSSLSGKSLYFDYGTRTLDSLYAPHQAMIDSFLRTRGFPADQWTSKKFEGHRHQESSWAERFGGVITFLLGK